MSRCGLVVTEVLCSFDEIGLIKIVRANAAHEQLVHEVSLNFDRVVDVLEEDGLVSHLNPGICQASETIANFTREFIRVVAVDGNEEGVKLFEHVAKGRRDPLGKEDGDA